MLCVDTIGWFCAVQDGTGTEPLEPALETVTIDLGKCLHICYIILEVMEVISHTYSFLAQTGRNTLPWDPDNITYIALELVVK